MICCKNVRPRRYTGRHIEARGDMLRTPQDLKDSPTALRAHCLHAYSAVARIWGQCTVGQKWLRAASSECSAFCFERLLAHPNLPEQALPGQGPPKFPPPPAHASLLNSAVSRLLCSSTSPASCEASSPSFVRESLSFVVLQRSRSSFPLSAQQPTYVPTRPQHWAPHHYSLKCPEVPAACTQFFTAIDPANPSHHHGHHNCPRSGASHEEERHH